MKNVADIYALSPMQQLMLWHARTADSAHDVLFNQIVYEIDGRLDPGAYQQAWTLMVERHAALRTIFVWQDGKDPLQIVREEAALPWEAFDWSYQGSEEQARELAAYLAADQAAGFDLLRAPLMRLALIRRREDSHWLVWSSHHLVIDRWCIDILFDEVQAAYEAFNTGRTAMLPPAPRYRDYIAWLAAQDEEAAADYWRETLAGVDAGSLPLKPGSAGEAPDLDNLKLSIDSEAWAALRRFAVRNAVTPSTLVTAAWSLVLGAATGAEDALFGLTVSGRPADMPQVERTVGCFINNVPFRVRLDGAQSLEAWLQVLQEQQLSLQPYEYASPAQIRRWSAHNSKGPLFETLLVLQAPVRTAVPAGLAIRPVRGGMQTGYPISVGAVPGDESLRLTFTFDARRAPVALVTQLAAALRRVLEVLPEMTRAALADLRAKAQIDMSLTETSPRIDTTERSAEWHYMPPRSVAELALAQLWAETLALPHVSVNEKFFDLGGDSISAIQLLTLVEERLGTRLPVSVLFRNPSVAQMAEAMDSDVTLDAVDPIVLPINTEGARPPFFFLHGLFGDVSSMTNVVPLLLPDQPLYGLQDPRLGPDGERDLTLEELAAEHVAAIRRVQPNGPYHMGGFCFGGVLAYEVARQLDEAGEKVALLAIIEGSAPRELHQAQPIYNVRRLQMIRDSLPFWLSRNEEMGGLQERLLERLRGASPQAAEAQEPNAMLEELADYDAMRPEAQFVLRELNRKAINAYSPPPFGGRVTLFQARNRFLGHLLFREVDPQQGWGNLARGGVSVRSVDGTHVGILKQPHVADLARSLTEALDEAAKGVLLRSSKAAGRGS